MIEFNKDRKGCLSVEAGKVSTRTAAQKFAEELERAFEIINSLNNSIVDASDVVRVKETDTTIHLMPMDFGGYTYEFKMLFTEGDGTPLKTVLKKDIKND